MKDNTKEKQVIEACKRQEWAAQKELYLLYADEMMSIAIRYAKDIASAKDLVQETFITGLKKIEQFDEDKGTIGGWLRKILINKSYAQYRKNKRMLFEGEEILIDQVSNETSVIESLEAEDILKLLEKLPDGCSMIFNLKVVEGYSHVEIGEMLGISQGTSRSQLSRAKKLLRDMINRLEGKERHINQKYQAGQA